MLKNEISTFLVSRYSDKFQHFLKFEGLKVEHRLYFLDIKGILLLLKQDTAQD